MDATKTDNNVFRKQNHAIKHMALKFGLSRDKDASQVGALIAECFGGPLDLKRCETLSLEGIDARIKTFAEDKHWAKAWAEVEALCGESDTIVFFRAITGCESLDAFRLIEGNTPGGLILAVQTYIDQMRSRGQEPPVQPPAPTPADTETPPPDADFPDWPEASAPSPAVPPVADDTASPTAPASAPEPPPAETETSPTDAAPTTTAPKGVPPERRATLGPLLNRMLREAFGEEGLKGHFATATGYETSTAAYDALSEVELLAKVKAYIDDQKRSNAEADTSQDSSSISSNEDFTLGALLVQAKGLARALRGSQADIAMPIERLAESAARSGYYGNVRSFDQALIICWHAVELGIPPTVGLLHLQVTRSKEGGIKIGQSYLLMLALALASGELETLKVDTTSVTLQRRGLPALTVQAEARTEKAWRAALRRALRAQFADVLTLGLRVLRPEAEGRPEVQSA